MRICPTGLVESNVEGKQVGLEGLRMANLLRELLVMETNLKYIRNTQFKL